MKSLFRCADLISFIVIDYLLERYLHLSLGRHVSIIVLQQSTTDTDRLFPLSYFVTELLGTDLHRLLTSRPLEKQFIQYFLYQILVS
jgi:hypothetical protein